MRKDTEARLEPGYPRGSREPRGRQQIKSGVCLYPKGEGNYWVIFKARSDNL